MAENNNMYFLCNVCNNTFGSFDDISTHLLTHSNNTSTDINELVSLVQFDTVVTNTAQDADKNKSILVEIKNAEPKTASIQVIQAPDTDKLWASETILLLINLVEKYDQEFQTKIKKHVWQKIAQEINRTLNTDSYDWNKCNTKWKGLMRTYKDIKQHNATSGKNRRQWEYFNIINNFYCKKPEITPVATCSNLTGLVRSNTDDSQSSSQSSSQMSSTTFESSFTRKRKLLANSAERRHREKMANQQRYLDIMDKMLEEMKKQNALKEDPKKGTD